MTERTDARPELLIRVLGPVTVVGPAATVEIRGRQPRAVAAYLALEPHSSTPDALAEVLWGERPSAHWRGAIRGVLSKVRAALADAGYAPDVVRSDDTHVRVDATVRTDLATVEAVISRETVTLAELDDARELLGHPFLPDEDGEWGRRVRQRIHRAARSTDLRLAAELTRSGSVDAAIEHLQRIVDADPLDETAQHALVSTLVAADRHTAATAAYELLAKQLADEFGVAPAVETAELLSRRPNRARSAPNVPARHQSRHDAPIHPHTDEPFVGRVHELDVLDRAFSAMVIEQRPRLVVLEGPPGIGKTRLADHFCQLRRATGVVDHIAWGRNRANGERDYGAVADLVDRLLVEQPELLDDAGIERRRLSRLLSGADDAGDRDIEAPSPRGALVRTLRQLFETLATRRSVVVLDDLHWASIDELAVLEAVIDGLRGPLMVILTTRHPPPEVAAALAGLQRFVATTTLGLSGLDIDDMTGLFPDPSVARRVVLRTGGLPFYASEIARATQDIGSDSVLGDVPATIADWVRRRVDALDPELAHVLQLASVLGDEVDTDIVVRCSASPPEQVIASLDELHAIGLLTSRPPDRSAGEVLTRRGDLRFSHDLTREIVYDQIGPASVAHLHRHVAAALIARDDERPNHAALAHHFGRAGDELRPEATAHALRAGQQSLATGAWETAHRHFREAEAWADRVDARVEALIGVGRACLAEQRYADAAEALTVAADLSDDHGLAGHGARAVLALVGRGGRGALHEEHDEEHRRLLRRSLAALERADPPPGSDEHLVFQELTSDLERELAFSLLIDDPGTHETRTELLERSLARARGLVPRRPRPLANALLGRRYAMLEPEFLDQRLADVEEARALGVAAVGVDVFLTSHLYEFEDLVRRGDRRGATRALDRADRLLVDFAHPYWGWATRTWRAIEFVVAGELDAAEATAVEAAAMRPEVEAATACLGVNLVNVRLYQGRADEVVPLLDAAVERYPKIPAYAAVLALCCAESGDVERAAAILSWFTADGFERLPHDTNRFLALASLAHVAATVGARDAAPALTALLDPFRRQWVVLNCYGGGGAIWGPTAHALARLAVLVGDISTASTRFDDALALAGDAPLIRARIIHDRDDALGSLPASRLDGGDRRPPTA